ncbi:hypothetical protein VCHA53O466_50250 [Vibrio chagasii]|nr:hypothetical protein VCHA53O466_50250 [Vibrio chagasii]
MHIFKFGVHMFEIFKSRNYLSSIQSIVANEPLLVDVISNADNSSFIADIVKQVVIVYKSKGCLSYLNAAAGNPNISVSLQMELYELDNKVSASLASNHSIHDDVATKIIKSSSPSTLELLAKNPSLSTKSATTLCAKIKSSCRNAIMPIYEDVAASLAANLSTSHEDLLWLSDTLTNYKVIDSALRNPNIGRTELSLRLTCKPNAEAISMNPSTSCTTLSACYNEYSSELVKIGVAMNRNTSSELLSAIVDDLYHRPSPSCIEVLSVVAGNPNCSTATQLELLGLHNDSIAVALVTNPNIATEALDQIGKRVHSSADLQLIVLVAKNPKTSIETLTRIASASASDVAASYARSNLCLRGITY